MLATNDLWIMTGINLALGAVCIALFSTMVREKIRPVTWGSTTRTAGMTVGEVT